MFNYTELDLHIPKVSFLLGSWGLLIFLGGVINQWFNLSADFTLLLWVGITFLGIATQVITMVKGLEINLGIWVVLMLVGWVFTFYVVKFDGGSHIDLFGDLSGVWLILLGIGYIATAFQVDKRFLIVAGLHLVVGALLEVSSRQIASISFLDTYSTLIFGVTGGLPLVVAAFPVWFAKPQPASQPRQAQISPRPQQSQVQAQVQQQQPRPGQPPHSPQGQPNYGYYPPNQNYQGGPNPNYQGQPNYQNYQNNPDNRQGPGR